MFCHAELQTNPYNKAIVIAVVIAPHSEVKL